MSDKNLNKLYLKSYLKMIENSVGTVMFNTFYVKNTKTGKSLDVYNNGHYSCAFYVSSILSLFGIIDRPHSTVETLVRKISVNKKWVEVRPNNLLPGDVIVWDKITWDDGSEIEHVGFYLKKNLAVSTSWTKRRVIEHLPTFAKKGDDGYRRIARAFRFTGWNKM